MEDDQQNSKWKTTNKFQDRRPPTKSILKTTKKKSSERQKKIKTTKKKSKRKTTKIFKIKRQQKKFKMEGNQKSIKWKKTNKNTPGTAGGPGGRDRMLAVKSRKNVRKITFFS